MDKSEYLQAFQNEVDAFVAAAERGLDAPVPASPPWTVGELAVHLGGVYIHIRAILRGGLNKPPPFNEKLLVAGEAEHELAGSPGLIDWFRSEAEAMEGALRDLAPDQPVWTFGPPRQQGGFWHRRMAQETIIHRWDAESAHVVPRPIETSLAIDGLDEMVDTWIFRSRRRSKLAGTGESYWFRPTDTERSWLVRFDADRFEVELAPGPADVTLGGTASDLLLFLWQRVPRDRLSIEGDPALLDRYFELAPPN